MQNDKKIRMKKNKEYNVKKETQKQQMQQNN